MKRERGRKVELILNLIRRRYCYHREMFNDKTVIKIMDRANGNRLVAIIYDEKIIEIIMRYLRQCQR